MIKTSDYSQRPEAIEKYLNAKKVSMWEQFNEKPIQMLEIHNEPCSALFAYRYKVDYAYIRDGHNPLTMWVEAQLTGELRPEAKRMLEELQKHEDLGYDRAKLGKGGGPFLAGWPTKRLARWFNYRHQLNDEAARYWQEPWWEEIGITKMNEMLDIYYNKTIGNLGVMASDPELVIGEKRPETGTGWLPPLENRGNFSRNLDRYLYMIENTIEKYYTDLRSFFNPDQNPLHQVWPNVGGIIHTETGFRGITKGSRSDVEITGWEKMETYQQHNGVREVGTDPSSVAHNKEVNTRDWEMTTWQRIGSNITAIPLDAEAWKRVLTSPPITSSMAVDRTHDIYLLNVDLGATPERRLWKEKFGFTVIQPETWKFGADNIWLSGIFLESVGRMHAHLLSGSPFTMKSYVLQHHGIEWVCRELGLTHIRVLGIGDDLQITGPLDELLALVERLGYIMRMKGMHGNIDFVTGTYRLWLKNGNIVTWIQPRFAKSVASPKDAADTPVIYNGGSTDWINVAPEATEQCDRFWQQYGDRVLHEGTVEEWGHSLDSMYWKMRKAMAELGGVSEWIMEQPLIPGG